MKEWVISIIGVVLLNLMAEIILSNSEISTFIKKIFSVVSIFIIIAPLSNLINVNFSSILDNLLNSNQYDEYIYSNQELYIENFIVETLKTKGFYGVKVDVKYNLSNNENELEKIILNLKNLVINENQVHINKYKEIKDIVCNALNVKEDIIVLNE